MTDELREKIIWQNINSSKEKGKILSPTSAFFILISFFIAYTTIYVSSNLLLEHSDNVNSFI